MREEETSDERNLEEMLPEDPGGDHQADDGTGDDDGTPLAPPGGSSCTARLDPHRLLLQAFQDSSLVHSIRINGTPCGSQELVGPAAHRGIVIILLRHVSLLARELSPKMAFCQELFGQKTPASRRVFSCIRFNV